MDIQVEGAVRILEVVVCGATVGAIRGAEERSDECVAIIGKTKRQARKERSVPS